MVPTLIYGGFGIEVIKEKVDPDSEPFQNLFLGSRTRTLYGTDLDPVPNLYGE